MLRGRSKDRNRKVTPPGPSYMSNEQFAEYLAGLRNNRVARPSGARPQPPSGRRESDRGLPTASTPDEDPSELPPRSTSVASHRRSHSNTSNHGSVSSRTGRALVRQPYPGISARDRSSDAPVVPLKPSEVVPTATYIERGQRWMEKEEAVALREAMEDMDLKPEEEEEIRIHAAAQEEASELVWQHQHPEAVPKPDAPYKYKEHLKKNSYAHARTQSVGRYGGAALVTGLARDIAPRTTSGSSNGSAGRLSSGSYSPEGNIRPSMDSTRSVPTGSQKAFGSLSKASRPSDSSRWRNNSKRNVSGEVAGPFTGDQIWEEPEQPVSDRGRSQEARDMPAPLRLKPRNPLSRVQFVQEPPPRASSTPPEQIPKISKYEIHRNPPSQSRNPAYTANPPPSARKSDQRPLTPQETTPEPNMRDGLEIRSDEIRQATSMRLKDRSPKLPTPAIVSDKPGRPIVSFDKNWKPKEADVKPEVSRRAQSRPEGQNQTLPSGPRPKAFTAPVPTIQLPDAPSISVSPCPPRPSIKVSDSAPSVPTINLPDAPAISVSAPAPTINVPGESTQKSSRPLPDPKKFAGRPLPRHNATAPLPKGHWSPAAGSRATASCHQCQLPIEGQVVAISGLPERFHPQCFICFSCGTALEALEISPEPPHKRAERLDRIQRRAQGEQLEEIEGQTMAEDGDDRLRFYCHLDWHESFAPRCKHCTTPIIGEHAVALGQHWHYGHFFCAECGDPFEKGMTHIEKDGYAWCLDCQTKWTERRAPKCKKCKQPVIGQYVQALGGEWHDACFRCAACNGGFDDGQIFPKQVAEGTIVLCTGCMERELKA